MHVRARGAPAERVCALAMHAVLGAVGSVPTAATPPSQMQVHASTTRSKAGTECRRRSIGQGYPRPL